MDNDSKMLSLFSTALIDLQVKFRSSPIVDRMLIRPSLEELMSDYADYQIKLIKEGTITTDADLAEMSDIKTEIEAAAQKQQLIAAIGRTIGFVAGKVA